MRTITQVVQIMHSLRVTVEGKKKLEFIQVYGKMYLQLNSFVTSLNLCAIEFMVSIPSIKF